MNKFLTVSQAAQELGVSSNTIRRWDETGKFKSIRHPVNNYRVYPEEQVQNFFREAQAGYVLQPKQPSIQEPFFQTKSGKLYCNDSMDFLKSLKTGSTQMVFADPPYNIKKAEWDSFESQKEYVEWSMKWISEAHRILAQEGTLYVCGFSEILADIKWAASHLFKGCKWLVWYYRNKANLGNDWGRSHESILHFRKSKNFIYNIDEVRVPYNAHTLRYPSHPQAETSQYGNGKQYVWTPHPKGAKPKDVFEIPTLSNASWEREKHPTQKPVELVKKCVLASSNEGGLVVDPFGGSGTTYAVAEAFKRKWLGSENNLEYCKIIERRLNDENHLQKISNSQEETEAIARREKLRGKDAPNIFQNKP